MKKRMISMLLCASMLATTLLSPLAVETAKAEEASFEPIWVTQTVTEELSLDDFDVIGCSAYDADTHVDLKEYYISDDSKGATFTLGGASGWSFLAYNLGSDKTLKSFEYDCNTSTTTLPISLGYARCRRSTNAYGEGFVGVYFNNWSNRYSMYHPYFLGSSEKPVVYESTDFDSVKTLAWQDGSNLTTNLSGHTENYIVAGNYHVKFEYTGEKNEHTMTLTESTGTCTEITLSSPAIQETTNVQNVQPDIPSLFFYKNYNYVSNIKITYTQQVDVSEQLGAVISEHTIATEIKNGLSIDDIGSSELATYVNSASAFMTAYSEADETVKELLVSFDYYNASLLNDIVELKDVVATEHVIPDYRKDVSLTTGDFTKVYKSGTDSIWALQENEQTSNLGKPVSFEYDVTYSQNNLPIALGYSNIYGNGSDREGYMFLNVYWRSTAKTVQYGGYIAGQSTITYAPIDFESVSSESVQVANNNAGSISEIGEAVKENQKLPTGTYHVCFQYEGNNAYTLTVTYLDELSYYFVINSKAVDDAYEDVPSIRFASAVEEISNIKVTYEGRKDMGVSVAKFVKDNPCASDFHSSFVGEDVFGEENSADNERSIGNYLSDYSWDDDSLQSLASLKSAYEQADENLKAALTRYGYYNETAVNTVLNGKGVLDEFKATYSTVIGETVDESMNNAEIVDMCNKALAVYEQLGDGIKIMLASEYNNVKTNRTKAIIELGTYSNDFDTILDDWDLYYDYAPDDSKEGMASEALQAKVMLKNAEVSGVGAGQPSDKILNVGSSVVSLSSGERTFLATDDQTQTNHAIDAVTMFSPSRALWREIDEAKKTLDAVSFDMTLQGLSKFVVGTTLYYEIIDENNFSYFRIGDNGDSLIVTCHQVRWDDETKQRKVTANSCSPVYVGHGGEENFWVRVSLHYDENGRAILIITGKDEFATSESKSENVVELSNRRFAVGATGGYNSTISPSTSIDNFMMSFKGQNEGKTVTRFLIDYAELLSREPDQIAPYDVPRVEMMSGDAESISSLDESIQATVTSLFDAAGKWSYLSNDEVTVADNFASIYSEEDTDYLIAWNVYNRLTREEKDAIANGKSELYQKMIEAVKNANDQSTETMVSCIGDSLTYGSHADNLSTDAYPVKLQEMLGESYVVKNRGIAGINVVAESTYTAFNSDNNSSVDENDIILDYYQSGSWSSSHCDGADVIILQLGTNDREHVENNEDLLTLYKVGLEKLIQSYLKLEYSPYIILSNTPYYSKEAAGAKAIAKANMEVAEKYGLPCVDMFAYTQISELSQWYSNDMLHLNTTGYAEMAKVFYNAMNAVDLDTHTYDEGRLNSFLTPIMNGAAIRIDENKTYNLGMKTLVPSKTKTGYTMSECGIIIAYWPSDDSAQKSILTDMTYENAKSTENTAITYAKWPTTFNDTTNDGFIAAVKKTDDSNIGYKYITRSYVVYTSEDDTNDTVIYYSVNDRNGYGGCEASFESSQGVIDGYAVRSVISVAKDMVKDLYKMSTASDATEEFKTNTGEVITGIGETGAITWSDALKGEDNAIDASKIFTYISTYKEKINQ